jgi:hypothetical protein
VLFAGNGARDVTREQFAVSYAQAPQQRGPAAKRPEETVMITSFSRKAQSTVCMILAAVIVTASLSLGAFAAEHAAAHDGYSVTITQIQ